MDSSFSASISGHIVSRRGLKIVYRSRLFRLDASLG